MSDGLRATWLIIALTFRADPWRAAWLVIRSPIQMCSVLGTAYGVKIIADAAVDRDTSGVLAGAALLVAVQLVGTMSGVGSLSARAMVIEKTSLLIDRRLMEAAVDVPGLGLYETPRHRDQLELLRLRRGELGEVVDSISHNAGMVLLTGGSVLLLAGIHPLLLLLPLAALPSLFVSPTVERMRVRAQEDTVSSLRTAGHLFEVATGAAGGKEVRHFGLQDALRERHRRAWDYADRRQDAAVWKGGLMAAGAWLVFAAAYVAAIWLVVVLATRGQATIGDVLLAVQLAAGVNRFVQGVVFMAGWLVGQILTAGRVVWLADYARASRRPHSDPAPVPDRLRKGITFENVSFRYPDSDSDVLHDFSVHIPAGVTAAVIGENGAGKSTLIKLMAGLYEPTAGRILVDGVDLRRLDPVEWRERWAAGFQDFVRFELLAGETVGVGDLPRVADEAAIGSALARAAATEVVAGMPAGTNTPLGRTFDDGVELSGGQWQKLALGRAMMRDAPLMLVLDEPTASLDALTEHQLFLRYAERAELAAERTGAVTVLVSHRFTTVQMADLVVVLDGGRVAEAGSHRELMATRGLYAELYELQAKAYR